MRAHDFVTEIDRIGKDEYVGGKNYLRDVDVQSLVPLPGGSGLFYGITGSSVAPVISIWDPEGTVDPSPPKRLPYEFTGEYNKRLAKWKKQRDDEARGINTPKTIGKLTTISWNNFPLKGSLIVGTITVDEDYRGLGIAKALYGIVLTILKRPLIAGDSQTPGGRRNWVSLSQIPGVEVRGWVKIDDNLIDDSTARSDNIDVLMGQLGADYMGTHQTGFYKPHYFSFDVQPGKDGRELEATVKTHLSKIYNEGYKITTGLYAVWTGQA